MIFKIKDNLWKKSLENTTEEWPNCRYRDCCRWNDCGELESVEACVKGSKPGAVQVLVLREFVGCKDDRAILCFRLLSAIRV